MSSLQRRLEQIWLWPNSFCVLALFFFCAIENLHCCGLRQEGYWFDQDQRCSFEPSSTWYPQVEGLRAHLRFGWGQVRQRKLCFIHFPSMTADSTDLWPSSELFLALQVDIRVRVKGGGSTSQIYAIRQAIAKGIVAYYQKCKFYRCLWVAWLFLQCFNARDLLYVCLCSDVDEASKRQLKETLVQYDRTLLVADPRRCEPKKFGGPGARARYQKSYR